MLLPYQQRWVSDISPVKVIEKSRRIGISFATASEAVTCAITGTDAWYVGYDEKMAKEFIGDCGRWARAYELATRRTVIDGQTFTQLRIKNGGKVTALSSTPRTLRGKKGFVIVDEAAFHDDLAGVLKSAIAVTMWGGRVAIISTHFGAQNAFNKLIGEIRSGTKPFSLHRVTLDDALNEGLYERICWAKGIDASEEGKAQWVRELLEEYGEFANEELYCIPDNINSSYFPQPLLLGCAVPCPVHRFDFADSVAEERHAIKSRAHAIVSQIEFSKTPEQVCLGIDFGRLQDITAIAIMDTSRQLVSCPVAIVELSNAPFSLQEEIIHALVGRLGCVVGIGVDGTGNGAWLAEQMTVHYGALADDVKLNNTWYAESFGGMKEAMGAKRFFVPQDRDILSDLLHVTIIDGIPKIPKAKNNSAIASGGRTKSRHGDAAVALALAHRQIVSKCLGAVALSVHERYGNHKYERNSQKTDEISQKGGWF